MFESIVRSLRANPQRFQSYEQAAVKCFESNRDLVLTTPSLLITYLETLFVCQNSIEISRILSYLFPNIKINVFFKNDLDTAFCECLGAGRAEVSFFFSKHPVPWLLPVAISRWLPVLEVFNYNLLRNPFMGKLSLNFHDEGRGNGLNFCDNRDFDHLIPDPEFLANRGYLAARQHYEREDIAWNERADKLFWRGSTTGTRTGTVLELPRVKLCILGTQNNNKQVFDTKITSLAQLNDEEAETVRSQGIIGDFIGSNNYNRHKYHVDIDGNTNAWSALFLKLLSGGLVFKVQSPFNFRQWYYDRLVAWEHYVPIQPDLSDLEYIFARLHADQDLAREIARRGREYASNLTYEAEVERTSAQMSRLASIPAKDASKPDQIITVQGDKNCHQLALSLAQSLERALICDSKLLQTTLEIPGFTGVKFRHLLNNLVSLCLNARYLEIGSWAGSSACSAIEFNKVSITCVDDFSEPSSSKAHCLYQLRLRKTPISISSLIASDFRSTPFAYIGRNNIFFYDGPADDASYKDAFKVVTPALDQIFILIINNWNWDFVRVSARASMRAVGMEVMYSVDIRSSSDNTHPVICCESSDWHNGCLLAVVSRKV